jgi:hypothetical protein
MIALVNIEKVDTKKFQINVTIDEADLKAWATNYVSDQDHDFKIVDGLKIWNEYDEYDNVTTRVDEAGENWHHEYVSEYLLDQDADRLMLDHCHDHSQYDLISEESSVIGFEGDLT